jgi:DNA-binding NarL/FixJ family response regulator
MIALVAADLGLVQRWSEGVRRSGRELLVLDEPALQRGAMSKGGLCLFDLGGRGGGDPGALLRVMAARPGTLFIALTAHPTAEEGLRMLRAGVRGYCNRLAGPRVIGAILDSVEAGEIWAGRQVTDYLLAQAIGDAVDAGMTSRPALFQVLTRREYEIAEQVAAGSSNKLIAAEAGITERTVKTHLNNIFRKTGVTNRVQLALAINQAEAAPRKLSNG